MPSLKAQTEPAARFQRKSAAVGEGIGVTKLSDINCVGRSETEEDTKEIRWKRRLHKSLALNRGAEHFHHHFTDGEGEIRKQS